MLRTLALLSLIVSLTLTACNGEPLPPAAPQDQASLDRALLSTLAIAKDGTLIVVDEATAAALLGDAWSAAAHDLERLNREIRSGQTPPFTSREELLAGHRLPGWEEAGVTYTAADVDPKNPHCKKGTCSALFDNTCCCDWWWFICFKSGCPCTP